MERLIILIRSLELCKQDGLPIKAEISIIITQMAQWQEIPKLVNIRLMNEELLISRTILVGNISQIIGIIM